MISTKSTSPTSPMTAARSAADLAKSPAGKYFAGDSFLVWCWNERLFGTAVWGTPDTNTIDALLGAWRLYEQLAPDGYAVITDARRLEHFDPAHYPRLLAFAQQHRDAFEARLQRHALVLAESLPALAASGLYTVVGVSRFERYADVTAAFRFVAPTLAATVQPVVEALVAVASHESATLAALRTLLTNGDPALSIADAADQLNLSTRGLQRALYDAGSTYRHETDRARVALACTLLDTTDLKIEAIAHRVGCSQTSGFARLFLRVTGEVPTDYRARRGSGRSA